MSTGSIIKSLREGANLSQLELARRSGVSRSTISELESDKYSLTTDKLDKLSATLAEFTDLAYVAGLFDRQSQLTVVKLAPDQIYNDRDTRVSPHYRVRVGFNTKYLILAEVLKKVFGVGGVSPFRTSIKNGRPYYAFYAGSAAAEDVITKLLPYLRVKRTLAEKILELRQIINFNRHARPNRVKFIGTKTGKYLQEGHKHIQASGLDQQVIDKMESLYQEIKAINKEMNNR